MDGRATARAVGARKREERSEGRGGEGRKGTEGMGLRIRDCEGRVERLRVWHNMLCVSRRLRKKEQWRCERGAEGRGGEATSVSSEKLFESRSCQIST